jgi:hypothetical protein
MNYRPMPTDVDIHVFAIRDSHTFGPPATWTEQRAYYFTGLEYRMLVCPALFARDEPLVERPGLYLKTHLPLAGLVYFPELPADHDRADFLGNLEWMADSYLFKFNASRPPFYTESAPRLYVNYANRRPYHGPNVFDNARVHATAAARDTLFLLGQDYSAKLSDYIASHPGEIFPTNYSETSLVKEVCLHKDLLVNSLIYVDALAHDNPQLLARSTLTNGYEPITCTKKYNRVVLSFYLAAIKESFPNSPGSYIGMFKNLYNVLEYLMEGEGEARLCAVLRDQVGIFKLKTIIFDIKRLAPQQSLLQYNLNNGERLSPHLRLAPLSETDSDLAEKIANRFYTKRNAVLHSKKTFHGAPVYHNVRPGPDEGSQLETDLAILRPIAETIVEQLDPSE